jgi:protein-S-isoprenylcysteine O-methyltransferase Ste14
MNPTAPAPITWLSTRNPWLLTLLVAILAAVLQMELPWWSAVVLAFGLCFGQAQSGKAGFLAGFVGLGLSWLVPAAWLAFQNHGLLAHRVAQLLPLGGSVPVLVLVTTLVIGLAGGLAGLAGCWLREAFAPARGAR